MSFTVSSVPCSRYCRTHFELYRRFVPGVSDEGLFADFESTMCDVFCAKLLFEGKYPGSFIGQIHSGVSKGVKLSIEILNKKWACFFGRLIFDVYLISRIRRRSSRRSRWRGRWIGRIRR